MKEIFKFTFNDKIIKSGMVTSIFIIIIEIIIIAFLYNSLPPILPIFNQLPWGSQRLGGAITIYIPSTVTLLFFVINFFIILNLHEKTPLLSRILSITTLLISILSLIFIIRTLQLII